MRKQLRVTISGGEPDEREALASVLTSALDQRSIDVEGRNDPISIHSQAVLMAASSSAPVRMVINDVLERNRLI